MQGPIVTFPTFSAAEEPAPRAERLPVSALLSKDRTGLVLPILTLALFIFASAAFRPVLPPDETRYLTVAWEMLVRGDFVLPTVNFAAYHQKPPLLFWLIDVAWAVFGVSRLAVLAAIFAISALVVALGRKLATELFPGDEATAARVGWATLGNTVFVVYSGLVLFDLLLTACVLVTVLALFAHLRAPARRWIVLAGLGIGLGLLAKGPATLVFVLWPVVTYPLWRSPHHRLSPAGLWKATGLALLVALLPLAAWVVPVLIATHGEFARTLIWDQTAGRISGNLRSAHARPFWFYLPLLPLFALPWLVSPYLWKAHREALGRFPTAFGEAWRGQWALRLLVLWFVPTVLTFSLISGKQPHYLVPLLPAAAVLSAWLMRTLAVRLIALGAAIMLALALVGQAVGGFTVLRHYDLSVPASIAREWKGPIAFVGNYQGELGFLGRLDRPLDVVGHDAAGAWLDGHPDGLLVTTELGRGESLPGRTVFQAPFDKDKTMAASVAPVR